MTNNPQHPGYPPAHPQHPGQFAGPPNYRPQGFGNQPFGNQGWGNQPFGNQGFGNQPFRNPWGGAQQFPGQTPVAYQHGPPAQFGGRPPQQFPVQYPPPAPRRGSILPAVLIVAVALVAVIGLVKLTSDPGGGDGPTATRYQHEDYQIPPAAQEHPDLPWPANDTDIKNWLENNALYAQQMAAPVRCELGTFDHTTATSDQKKVQLEKTLVCLVRVWGPTLEAAGFTITHPTVTMYDAPIQNACGKAETHNAFYCGVDQNLYFATDVHEILGEKANDAWAYETVMAHEFGHSVQGRSGIIPAKAVKSQQATDEAGQLEPTRRNEAQADCLAGLFFNSVHESMGLSDQQVRGIGDFFGQIGNDDPTKVSSHPQPPTRARWFAIGAGTTAIGNCNSYVAPLDEVK